MSSDEDRSWVSVSYEVRVSGWLVARDGAGGRLIERADGSRVWVNRNPAALAPLPEGLAEALETIGRADKRGVLLKAAEDIERELICCDIYDELFFKPAPEWTEADHSRYRLHSICYWGRAAMRIVEGHAEEHREVE